MKQMRVKKATMEGEEMGERGKEEEDPRLTNSGD